jgi:hypothetical protein
MKTLKEKFGQFEMTKEQMKMVKGGFMALCTRNNGEEELIASDTLEGLQELATEQGHTRCEML